MGPQLHMGQPQLPTQQPHMRMSQQHMQISAMMPGDSPLSMLAGTATGSPGLLHSSPKTQKRAAEVAMSESPGASVQHGNGVGSNTHKHLRRAFSGIGAGACGWETGQRLS
mmetsp:Transcript_13712/g.44785  ORF Transcript_13712/g.44785 Transcript_13712/m.44785 type:complete len:111 (-) Transcript_13712:189-521(-)